MPYTATQRKLIKGRVRAYYYATKAEAPYRFGWKDLAGLIFDLTKVEFKGDSLRAIVEGQMSRGKRRSGGEENLDALVQFLTDPEVKALSLEELEEPKIPYLFAMQLVEFLNFDEEDEVALPPATMEGTYRAVCRSEDGISDISLEITLSNDGRLVHLEEASDIYRNTDADPAALSEHEKKRHRWRHNEFKGWGIFTPEENIIGFMKRLSQYGGNQYYSLTANIPRLSAEAPVQRLVLHAHDDPYSADAYSERWLEEIHRNVLQYNLRHFVRASGNDAEAEVS
jgi:predicted nucleic acid-binding protein